MADSIQLDLNGCHAPAHVIDRSYLAVQAVAGCEEGTDQFVERLRKEVVSRMEVEIQDGKLMKGKIQPRQCRRSKELFQEQHP